MRAFSPPRKSVLMNPRKRPMAWLWSCCCASGSSDDGVLKRACGEESLPLVELAMERLPEDLPALKAALPNSGDGGFLHGFAGDVRTRLDDEHRQVPAGDTHALDWLGRAPGVMGPWLLKPGGKGCLAGSPGRETAARAAAVVPVHGERSSVRGSIASGLQP